MFLAFCWLSLVEVKVATRLGVCLDAIAIIALQQLAMQGLRETERGNYIDGMSPRQNQPISDLLDITMSELVT